MSTPMKKYDMMAAILALLLTAAFIGAIIMLSWREFPSSNEQLLTYMLGQLSGLVAGAVGLYFTRRPDGQPSGTTEDPVRTKVVNDPGEPVPVNEETKP